MFSNLSASTVVTHTGFVSMLSATGIDAKDYQALTGATTFYQYSSGRSLAKWATISQIIQTIHSYQSRHGLDLTAEEAQRLIATYNVDLSHLPMFNLDFILIRTSDDGIKDGVSAILNTRNLVDMEVMPDNEIKVLFKGTPMRRGRSATVCKDAPIIPITVKTDNEFRFWQTYEALETILGE